MINLYYKNNKKKKSHAGKNFLANLLCNKIELCISQAKQFQKLRKRI